MSTIGRAGKRGGRAGRNNRHVQFPEVLLTPARPFRKQIAEVVDDFRDAHRLSCTSFDQLAATTCGNMRAIKRA